MMKATVQYCTHLRIYLPSTLLKYRYSIRPGSSVNSICPDVHTGVGQGGNIQAKYKPSVLGSVMYVLRPVSMECVKACMYRVLSHALHRPHTCHTLATILLRLLDKA